MLVKKVVLCIHDSGKQEAFMGDDDVSNFKSVPNLFVGMGGLEPFQGVRAKWRIVSDKFIKVQVGSQV